ncbi:hypothetical protein TEA_002580 [Camellia sinensis var. sinensis]|uniref:Ubiquitin thioesterase OTU n=1 Tax=Camellia sinensis var. sinensis TaxID=542762 RepID=A0A4S4DI04_CAMSN|nr:hypothetical protein TEA_002580 [Camellia sinensis var. sinensis]
MKMDSEGKMGFGAYKTRTRGSWSCCFVFHCCKVIFTISNQNANIDYKSYQFDERDGTNRYVVLLIVISKTMPKPDLSLGNNLRTIRIPGDGRCLFRSVAHGAYLRSGKPSPSESLQKELADELRDKVADEFIKRRTDTEWFIEGDFDTYVTQMRQPHIWGGEPELLMSSHVLQVPITVFMCDKKSGRHKIVAEYGQEYGKENPIRVLYHGYGHYDALQTPSGAPLSKL